MSAHGCSYASSPVWQRSLPYNWKSNLALQLFSTCHLPVQQDSLVKHFCNKNIYVFITKKGGSPYGIGAFRFLKLNQKLERWYYRFFSERCHRAIPLSVPQMIPCS